MTVDLSYDKQELGAIRWALGVIANAGKGTYGVSKGQELV